MEQDRDHLRLLSIFHFIVAILAALVSTFPLLHLALGIVLASGALSAGLEEAMLATFVGILVATVAAALIAFGLALAVSLGLAGWFLARHRHWRYCLVVACVACLFFPFGTVLGVLTLIVLLRPSVKHLFGEGPG